MRKPDARLCPGSHPGRQKLADVRDSTGVLLARVDAEQARELLQRGLIAPQERSRHFRVLDAAAVRLWARSRAGGSRTTVGPDERSIHRALKPMLGGAA